MDNPYKKWLFAQSERLRALSPDLMEEAARSRPPLYSHWLASNEWINAEMANVLLLQCYLHAMEGTPWAKSPALAQKIEAFFQKLVVNGHGGRWYHLQPGMGDRNLDRFTMLPFMEAYLLVGDDLEPELRQSVLRQISETLEVQLAEYGKSGRAFKRQYPNMDVYYCLIMLLGWRLTGKEQCRTEFERALKHLAESQFADGAWTYVGGMNESPGYHALVAILMGRIVDLSDHDCAKMQLTKSIAYYPLTSTRSGIMESHTDCWWKHQWSALKSYAPDVVASITEDGRNRWLADKVRKTTLKETEVLLDSSTKEISNLAGLFTFYASLLWKDVIPEALLATSILYDENIEGPRGHMQGWSWAASGRYGGDSVAGATAHTLPEEPLHALMAVTAEIPFFPADKEIGARANDCWNLAMLPEGSRGNTTIEGDQAIFEITYRLACCRAFFGEPAFPMDWLCEQHWKMDQQAMRGIIKLTSMRQQSSPLPIIRIRFGEGHHLKKLDESNWVYGRFRVVAAFKDFPGTLHREAPIMLSYTENDADEIVYYVNQEFKEPVLCQENQTLTFEVEIHFE